ncbi:MAG: ATP-binding cassette domain-containing protein [Acidobacteria bacterium]|nr:ATP-binding cassette domain-containing protein [Acidobacteriota bacterium]
MPEHYIEFQNVSKAFGDNSVLEEVSFFVDPAETLVIMGRSGVGKSVTLQHIMGFLKPDAGRVIVAGEDITDYPESELEAIRRKVTMVFQSGALFDSLTIFENVAFPLREQRDWTEQHIEEIVLGLLDLLEIRDLADSLPSQLSTGMKRATAIARALAAQPEAVLYDEPTTMVDPLMAHHIGDLIRKLKYQLKLTSVVVTHDTHLARKVADRVMFLEAGRAVFFGTTAELSACTDPFIQEFLQQDELHPLAG